MYSLFFFNIIFILLNDINTSSLDKNSNTESTNYEIKNLDNLDPLKIDYLNYVNYLNERISNLTKNESHESSLYLKDNSIDLKSDTKDNSTNQLINDEFNSTNQSNNKTESTKSSNEETKKLSIIDRIILSIWSMEESAKQRLNNMQENMKENKYVKKLYSDAKQIKKEDLWLPFLLGIITGLIFIFLLNLLRCCLIRFCCFRKYKVNRRFIGLNQRLAKRNALSETHHLLVNHNLSDQEV